MKTEMSDDGGDPAGLSVAACRYGLTCPLAGLEMHCVGCRLLGRLAAFGFWPKTGYDVQAMLVACPGLSSGLREGEGETRKTRPGCLKATFPSAVRLGWIKSRPALASSSNPHGEH
jgi:hypothetical protein